MKKPQRGNNLRKLRHDLGLNQHDFWSAVGVTQSGGSRYETGRSMSRPVSELVRLVHMEGIDLKNARGDHMLVGAELKRSNAALYQKLLQQARARRKR